MTWNYGVIERTVNGQPVFLLHEFFHTDDGFAYTEEPITFEADSLEELEGMLADALRDVGTARLVSGRDRAYRKMGEES